ncbi:hypothetical protein EX895_004632 [Sporisorium graminicola]|uniref:Uncharacterized protein n=1 Tax=Sporisorium graminicola TaxID=280036 RepID=A0A4U7KQD1_9BASI|nr:hypothetical protein EX895_004632 [Sporisorium graminicola]TKY86483.1 hypothetical protein EX895_004632 [Sporisorium graminicola]
MTPVPDTDSASATSFPPPQPPQHSPESVAQLPNAAVDLANRMFDLARSGDAALIDYLAAGLPPNLTNNRGDTILMLASYHGHVDLVRRMLTEPSSAQHAPSTAPDSPPTRTWRGQPDPNQLNGRGQSIVAGAVFKGFDDVVRLLIEHGADPLAGQPNAEECAQMFNKWDGETGFKQLFEQAPGRGAGGRDAAPAVEDREEMRRVPGVGLQPVATDPNGSEGEQQLSHDAPSHPGAER